MPRFLSLAAPMTGSRAADTVCRGTVDFVSKPANEGMTDSAGKLIRLDYFFDVAVDFCYKRDARPGTRRSSGRSRSRWTAASGSKLKEISR